MKVSRKNTSLGIYINIYIYIGVRFDAERDISSLGVRTGGWVEVDVSAVVVAVVALGGVVSTGVGYRRGRPMGQRKTGNPS